MSRRIKIWLISTAALLVYALAAWLLGVVLRPRLQPQDIRLLRIGLIALGVASAAVILWFFRTPAAQTPKSSPADDVDAAISQAKLRLAAAKLPGKANIGTLPAVLVLGPEGSAKTTAVVRSGLAPELLAGEVFRGETVAPTPGVNVWYGQDAVFIEAGGALAREAPRWKRLIDHLQPKRLRAALTGGTQAPRMALVCYSCEELVRPGAGEAAISAAKELRTRLGDVAQQLGIRLPVYVLFTKADTVPHYEAFVQNFTADEARQVLGAGLAADGGPAGTYGDRAGPAITSAFDELYGSLAAWRLSVLHRESAPERKPGAYEFPREMRKLQAVAVDFLRELGRPSQLEVSPVLRGFYFTGVQAVFVSESAAAAAVHHAAAAPSSAATATAVFSAVQARSAPAAPTYTPPRTRKVPRWNFLEGVFRDVVLADQSAMQVTLGGTRLNIARRALLATAAGLAILAAIGFTVSYSNNRALQREVSGTALALSGLPDARIDLPTTDALRRLDAARATLDRLSVYEREGAPIGLRWGLYSGGTLYESARRIYFDAFDKQLFGATRASLASSLRALPAAPTPDDDYGSAYGQLKAHLVTTTHPQFASMDFLPDVLARVWTTGRTVDDERRQLARRQFETYTRELALANPYRYTPDTEAVPQARQYLRAFQGVEPIYRGLLAEAAKKGQPVRFEAIKPEAARVITVPHEVPAAFTKAGWTFMQTALRSPDALRMGEAWVVGEQAVIPAADRDRTIRLLRTTYETDYADQWRTFLRTASIAPFTIDAAVAPLDRLAGNQSPLLELLSVVSQNTSQAPALTKLFQPASSLVPASPTAPLVMKENQPYLQALGALRDAIRGVVAAPRGPARQPLVEQAKSSAGQVTSAVDALSLGFTPDPAGVVHEQVTRLLRQPAAFLVGALGNVGTADANAAGARLCGALGGVLGKFPFAANSSVSASSQEVAQVLQPGTGSFWTIYNQSLTGVAVRQGRTFAQPPDAPYRVSPQFLQLLRKLALLSDLLFPEGAQVPRADFSVTLLGAPPELGSVTLLVDGEPMRTTQNDMSAVLRVPSAAGSREARLLVTQGTTESVVASAPAGPWSILRIFHQATRVQPAGDALRFEWTVPNVMRSGGDGTPVRVSAFLRAGAAAPLFMREEMAGGSCPGRIAF
jgi:type VI secretion system protein ImpL